MMADAEIAARAPSSLRVIFLTMGEENLATGLLSAILKRHGHRTMLAHDPALFDERIYFHVPYLARLFDMSQAVVDRVVEAKPDLVCVSVFSDNYVWASRMADRIRAVLDVPILAGGIHVTAVPEETIQAGHFDIICVGEGEMALPRLVDSMAAGAMDTSIPNLWFRRGETIIRNPVEQLCADFDTLPWFDKEIFDGVTEVRNRYMTLATRGCPFHCSYCAQNFLRFRFNKMADIRRRSVDDLIAELRTRKDLYRFKLVDLEDNVITANRRWFLDFAERYAAEVGVPYICMAHPSCIDDELAAALARSGCYRLQLGIQSLDEENRRLILKRPETNEQIRRCFDALDRHGVRYSVDHILGLPNERDEEHLRLAAHFYADCRMLHKVNSFWLTCFPGTEMVEIAVEHGMIKPEYVDRINRGVQDFYYDHGITSDPALQRLFKAYAFFLRVMPFLPIPWRHAIIDRNLVRFFRFLPKTAGLFVVDMGLTLVNRDPVSLPLLYSYLRNMWSAVLYGLFRIRPASAG